MIIIKKFGLEMKAKRESANLTQRAVSKNLGYTSPQFISNSERGLCVLPPPAFKKISKLYNWSLDEIRTWLANIEIERIDRGLGL